jgi:hypothetical protein
MTKWGTKASPSKVKIISRLALVGGSLFTLKNLDNDSRRKLKIKSGPRGQYSQERPKILRRVHEVRNYYTQA